MPPRRLHAQPGAPSRELGPHQVEALTVAMIVAPGVYARNRMFDLFTTPGARRARMRASLVRGIVPQLARADTLSLSPAAGALGEGCVVLRYAIATLRLTRVVELSLAELAALRLVAARSGVHALPAAPSDRHVVATALARLMDKDSGAEVARLVDGLSTNEH
jgi:hypothetical protein